MRRQLADEKPKEGLDVRSTFFMLHPARRRGCVKPDDDPRMAALRERIRAKEQAAKEAARP